MRANQLSKCVAFGLVLLAACATAIVEVLSSGDGWDQPVAFRMPEGELSAVKSGQTSSIFYCAWGSLVGHPCASPELGDIRADAVTADKDSGCEYAIGRSQSAAIGFVGCRLVHNKASGNR